MTLVAPRRPAPLPVLARAARRARPRALALGFGLLAATALVSPLALAAEPMTLPPSREGVYVYDLAEIWSPATEAEAQSTAAAIRARTQAQLAIVSWPSNIPDISTEEAREDAITIMNTWGVGREGIDDGLVVLFDMDEGSRNHGQVYVYGGRGFIEQYMSQQESDGIVFDRMLPLAAEGDLDGALLAGLRRIDQIVQPGGNPERGMQVVMNVLLGAAVLGGALLVFALFVRTWWQRGRDAEVPLIDDSVLLPSPPPGLTPALATVLRNDGVDQDGFTSALVDLGHRGLVAFQEADGDNKHVDVVVPPSPLIDPSSLEARRRPLGAAEDDLARSIAAKASGGVLSWASLKAGEGAKLYAAFKKNLGRAAKAAGYFREDPNKLSAQWAGIGVAVIVAAAVFAFFFILDKSEDSPYLFQPNRDVLLIPTLGAIALGVAIIVFSGRLVARTVEGARALAMALAYRNTLRYELKAAHTVDEAVQRAQTRLPWITTPDLLTVWAVAFGLRDEIDDLIKETFETAERTGSAAWSPAWYAGSGGVSSVGNLSSAIGSIGTTATSSSGGGYGGGGGGGGGGSGGGF
jgi:uncharacterized membrane protein YgcG